MLLLRQIRRDPCLLSFLLCVDIFRGICMALAGWLGVFLFSGFSFFLSSFHKAGAKAVWFCACKLWYVHHGNDGRATFEALNDTDLIDHLVSTLQHWVNWW